MAVKKVNIKKGDTVEIICGGSENIKTKGKKGKVQVVLPDENKVIVENLNMVKKHKKPRSAQKPGGIIEMPRAINISNVMLICPECGKKTRVGHTLAEDGKKYVRSCKKCGEVIDKKESKAKGKKAKADIAAKAKKTDAKNEAADVRAEKAKKEPKAEAVDAKAEKAKKKADKQVEKDMPDEADIDKGPRR